MTNKHRLSILIADDHELTRLGLSSAIKKKSSYTICGEAKDGLQACQLASELSPDLILMDLNMPYMDGLNATRKIKENYPECKIIILSSAQVESEIFGVIGAGANGYCQKDISMDRLIKIINLIVEGGMWLDPKVAELLTLSAIGQPKPDSNLTKKSCNELTARELDILGLIAEGLSNKEIAQKLGITLPTTKTHVSNLILKLQVEDRTQAAIKALKDGLLQTA